MIRAKRSNQAGDVEYLLEANEGNEWIQRTDGNKRLIEIYERSVAPLNYRMSDNQCHKLLKKIDEMVCKGQLSHQQESWAIGFRDDFAHAGETYFPGEICAGNYFESFICSLYFDSFYSF